MDNGRNRAVCPNDDEGILVGGTLDTPAAGPPSGSIMRRDLNDHIGLGMKWFQMVLKGFVWCYRILKGL